MIRTHKIALDPTSAQATDLSRTSGYARVAYHGALADFTAGLDEGRWRSHAELRKRFNATKDACFPWNRDLSQHAPQ